MPIRKINEKIRESEKQLALLKKEARRLRALGNRPPASVRVVYRGPNGQIWAGGRGRKPDWVNQAIIEGRSLAEFKVDPNEAGRPAGQTERALPPTR